MAGIYGFLNRFEQSFPLDAFHILRTSAVGGLGLPVNEHLFSKSAIGCAVPSHYSDTAWPLVSQDGAYALGVFGEIFLPQGAPLRKHNFEEEFLKPFLRNRFEFVRKLSGWFVFALISDKDCALVNDPSGNFAIHYTSTANNFAFSTQMMPLRKWTATTGFDEDGLFQHLGVSQSLNGRTLLTNISRLLRGTILHYANGKIRTEEYIERKFFPSSNIQRELDDVHDALANAVLQATQYKKVTAALSGGFDSRMTWGLVLENAMEEKVTASTHGLPNSRDMKIAGLIVKRFRLAYDRLPFTSNIVEKLPTRWRNFVALTEGLYPLYQIFSDYAMQSLGERYSVLIDSYGGALYRRQIKKFIEPRINPALEIAPQVLPYERTPLVRSNLLKAEIRQLIDEASLRGLREYYGAIEDIPRIGDKFDLFYADQTAALRDAFGANQQMNYIGLAQPLMDRKALETVARIPISLRRNEGIHRYIIHRAFPQLEKFSLDYSGFPAPYRGFSKLRLVAPGLEKLIRSAAAIVHPLRGFSLRRPPFSAWDIIKCNLQHVQEILLTSHPLYDPLIVLTELERKFRVRNDIQLYAQPLLQLLQFRIFLDIFY